MFVAIVMAVALAILVVALVTSTFRPPNAMDALRRLDLDGRPELLSLAERTERRARRIRRVGAIAGFLVGAWVGSGHHNSLGNSLAAPWAGYVAGLLVAELTLRLPKRDSIRSATLIPRRVGDLSSRWWRVAGTPMLAVTAVAAPLARLGRHPIGGDSYVGPNGSCSGTATWPSLAQVLGISVVALSGLIGIELLRWRLAARPAAAESATALFEERRRQWVSRAADRTGLALALALLATLAYQLAAGLRSETCEPWRHANSLMNSDVYTSQLADFGRGALEPLALVLIAASAAVMAWAPRRLRRAPVPQPVPVP